MYVSESGVCNYQILKQCFPKSLQLPFLEIWSSYQHFSNWAPFFAVLWIAVGGWISSETALEQDVDICDVEYVKNYTYINGGWCT